MKFPARIVAFLGLPLVAWLMLGMPDGSEIGAIWVGVMAFFLFWSMTMFQGAFLRLVGVDMDVYDNVVPWLFDGLNLLAAIGALALCAIGLFGGEAVRGVLASGFVAGIVLLAALLLLLVPVLFARRTLGDRGVRAIPDPRESMKSASPPARSMAEFEVSQRDAGPQE